MNLSLNSNVSSDRALRQLGRAERDLGGVFERLSSGLRIVRASDDAAGLSISASLRGDRLVYSRAIQNVSDGVSAIAIAEGASQELLSITTRLVEISAQGSNGTINASQRLSLQKEADALVREYSRIIDTTEFNGINLFSTSAESLSMQVGYNSQTVQFAAQYIAGTGTFSSQTTVTTLGSNAVKVADFNNDRKLDIVSARTLSGGYIHVSLGNGDGTFVSPTTFITGTNPQSAALAVYDVNSDGNIDVLTSEEGATSENLVVLLGNGDGSFRGKITYSFGYAQTATGLSNLAVADFTGDGITDVLAVAGNDSIGRIMVGNGNGSFSIGATYTHAAAHGQIGATDLNGDNLFDVFGASGGTIAVRISTGDQLFGSISSYRASGVTGFNSVVDRDVNNDGITDLVAGTTTRTVAVLLGNGDGSFRAGTTFQGTAGGDNMFDPEVADLNGDGFVDIAVANRNTANTTDIFYGNGDGSFYLAKTFASPLSPNWLEIADLNNDKAPDLVIGDFNAVRRVLNTPGVAEFAVSQRRLDPIDVRSVYSSKQDLVLMGQHVDFLTQVKAALGSSLSRAETAIRTLQSATTELAVAESRITDLDVAEEAATLTRLSILREAASAILAQANQKPELTLSLLSSPR